MNTVRMITTALAALGMTTAAMAAEPETGYTLNVSRLGGAVECVVTNPQNEKAAFDCSMKLKGNKTIGIGMKKAEHRLIGEKEHVFYGVDLFTEGKVVKSFVVVADKAKALKFVSFADVVKSEAAGAKELRMNVAGNAASKVKAVSINPLHVQINKDKTEIKVGVWFTLYSQDKAQIADVENGIIPSEVMEQIELQVLNELAN